MTGPRMIGFSLVCEEADDRDELFAYEAELTVETVGDIKTFRTSRSTCIAAIEAVLEMAGDVVVFK
jgi:hypothetical protein